MAGYTWLRRYDPDPAIDVDPGEPVGLPQALLARVRFSSGHHQGSFLLLHEAETDVPAQPAWSTDSPDAGDPVVLLRGVASSQRFRLQAPVQPQDARVIREFRIACRPDEGIPVIRVSHALIPLSYHPAFPEEILMVREADRPVTEWKLPGGRLEDREQPGDALLRELEEELLLTRAHLAGFRELPVPPDAPEDVFTDLAVSRSTGLRTRYIFHPFLVRLTPAGRRHLWDLVNQGGFRARPVSLDEWRDTGCGYPTDYPRQLHGANCMGRSSATGVKPWPRSRWTTPPRPQGAEPPVSRLPPELPLPALSLSSCPCPGC